MRYERIVVHYYMPAESERRRREIARHKVLIITREDALRARENLRRMAEAEVLRQTRIQKRRNI